MISFVTSSSLYNGSFPPMQEIMEILYLFFDAKKTILKPVLTTSYKPDQILPLVLIHKI